ncbi:hypothetical protein EUTSA_v100092320mg [Eutrema salsugineum]|uniref:MORN repeat-containing protein 5 n=1 Tax=Eutrema salsugineum TaxID=72664 RepID=V4KAA1_EUTSA|nr:hypothetical protein EUTSA_v100092320mg [Eutrema salsugineum]
MVRSRAQVATRRVTPTPLVDVEKPLPNGDLYIGSFSGGFPHGSGKYLWKDGCMYEGDWETRESFWEREILMAKRSDLRRRVQIR